ncbi:MAG: hypothetical protein KDK25_14210 [Leptospiraceae bacterium]|nr:hypothetical protein [Leptospiraceae bacterium]
MEYEATLEERTEGARKSLFRWCLGSGSFFALLTLLTLLGNFMREEGQLQGWLTFLYFLVPAAGLLYAFAGRKDEAENAGKNRKAILWIIRICGVWISLSILSFPSTLAQSPVGGLVVVGVFALGMGLLISSLRFRG